jgi:hypothetical protein
MGISWTVYLLSFLGGGILGAGDGGGTLFFCNGLSSDILFS